MGFRNACWCLLLRYFLLWNSPLHTCQIISKYSKKDAACMALGGPHKAPNAQEILMFVCLQKGVKQCCDEAKSDRTHCASHWPLVRLLQRMHGRWPAQWVLELCFDTALFGIFLETNKHQNLTRLKHAIVDHEREQGWSHAGHDGCILICAVIARNCYLAPIRRPHTELNPIVSRQEKPNHLRLAKRAIWAQTPVPTVPKWDPGPDALTRYWPNLHQKAPANDRELHHSAGMGSNGLLVLAA